LTIRSLGASTLPVLSETARGQLGADFINQPRVVAVTADHWRMYYTGWGFKGDGSPWAMGLAESFDGGTRWRRATDEPILARGDASSPDGGGACVPMVLRVGDRWMMWYTGRPNQRRRTSEHSSLSRDLARWRDVGEVRR